MILLRAGQRENIKEKSLREDILKKENRHVKEDILKEDILKEENPRKDEC